MAPRRDSQAGHADAHAFAQKMRAFPGGQGEQAADQVARTQPWPTVSLRRDEGDQDALAHGELQLLNAQARGTGDFEECQAAFLSQLA